MDNFLLRSPRSGDINFIVSTWVKSSRNEPSFLHHVPKNLYVTHKTAEVKTILCGARGTILCDPDDQDKIYGYLVCEKSFPVIHYLYVKNKYQNMGFGTELLKSFLENVSSFEKVIVSHLTLPFLSHFIQKPAFKNRMFFNPYVLRDLGY